MIDPTIQPDSGINQDANPTPDSSETTDVNETPETKDDETSNPEDEGKTTDQLKSERTIAVQEAIKNSKEAKNAKAELEYYKTIAQVSKDPNQLVSVNTTDPEKAEKIAQELYGKSYDSLLEGNTPSTGMSKDDVEKMIEAKFNSQKVDNTGAEIDTAITNFFVDNNIQPGTDVFRKINNDLEEFTIKNARQAKIILSSILNDSKPVEEQEVVNNAPNMSYTNTGTKPNILKKTGLTKSAINLIKDFGYSDDQIKKSIKK